MKFKRKLQRKNKPHYHKSRYSKYTGFEAILGIMKIQPSVNPYTRQRDE